MNKVSDKFRAADRPAYTEIANQLEVDYGTAIFESLTGEDLNRKGQRVRLFDQTTRSAEAYFPSDERGKPYVQDFQEGRRWYPISAWMEAHSSDWKTAVRVLSEQYLGGAVLVGSLTSKNLVRRLSTSPSKRPTSYHDSALVASTQDHYERNNLAIYLRRLVGVPVANELLARFQIGTCLEGISLEWARSTVYWQIDEQGRVRSGKVIYHSLATGKRMKEKNSGFALPFWLHDVLAMRDFVLDQCLFGLHQISTEPTTKPIAVVESEKSAIIATAFEPGFIWMASGGLSNLHTAKFTALSGRQIVLFPDLGGFAKWSQKADELTRAGYAIHVSPMLESRAKTLERRDGWDIADYLTRHRCPTSGRALTEPEGYPALWDCHSMNAEPTIKPVMLTNCFDS